MTLMAGENSVTVFFSWSVDCRCHGNSLLNGHRNTWHQTGCTEERHKESFFFYFLSQLILSLKSEYHPISFITVEEHCERHSKSCVEYYWQYCTMSSPELKVKNVCWTLTPFMDGLKRSRRSCVCARVAGTSRDCEPCERAHSRKLSSMWLLSYCPASLSSSPDEGSVSSWGATCLSQSAEQTVA